MYETKKQAAFKTMEKKAAKLDEIARMLADDIVPTLERLRAEKATYLRWSANSAGIERLEKFAVAADLVRAERALLRAKHMYAAGKHLRCSLHLFPEAPATSF